jgi:predicted ATPase/DNA-binding SARP family transcriptional activator
VEFRVLGRLGVFDGEIDVTPTRPKARALLALLLLRAGRLVSVDEAADALWGERPPPTARNAVQGHIATLRRVLGSGRVETSPGGYRLLLDEDELDLHRFERLLTEAAGHHPQERSERLAAALRLFRGSPLEEFRYESFAAVDAARIDELRVLALEERIDADLALGRHTELVAELEELIEREPLRERLRSQLMLALYRSGRQADALEAYQRARRTLGDELAIDPSVALRRLEQQMLNQDPALDLPRARESPSIRIPTPPTALLGREQELAEARDLLVRKDVHLLTLTGPGGIGKTRLAFELARSTLPRFSRGVYYVPLAGLVDPGLVLPTLARAIGVVQSVRERLVETLARRLAGGETLVVLDNFEHVIDASSEVERLLEAASGLTVLVTSREALRVGQEQLYRVPPLDASAANALFLDRALAVCADLPRGETTVRAIAEICGKLDRSPLPIELAAARTTMFSPMKLLARLDERLAVLTVGSDERPERQQTLRRTIAWSYELLTGDEQRLFACLGVFAGGWTLAAAHAVCSDGIDVVKGVASLADKSLLQIDATDPEPRAMMLETIREYANEQLDRFGESTELPRRHAEYFGALAEEAEPYLRGSPGEWLDRLEQEHDNLRAAIETLSASGETIEAVRLTGALWRFWYLRGHATEGRRRLEAALSTDNARTAARARALHGAGVMAIQAGDPTSARRRAEEALSLNLELDDVWGAAYSRLVLGHAAGGEGDNTSALQFYEDSVRDFLELGDDHTALLASRNLAWTSARVGDRERARRLHEENLLQARATANARIHASSLGDLASIAIEEGRFAEAMAMLRKSLEIHREIGDILDSAVDLCRYAAALAHQGRPATAARILASFEASGERIGPRRRWVADMNEQSLAAIRQQLDETALAEAWEQGEGLSLDDALTLASAD